MKKQFAALLTALSLLPTLALAQEYYTLPEIREQAKDGWHETYTDRYGREIQVDIDADVFGEQTAPLIKAGFPQHDIYYADKNCPYNTVSNVIEQFKEIIKDDSETHFAALSAGMLMCTRNDTFADAYSKADKALYYVKQNGKNNYSWYNQIHYGNTANTSLDLKQIANSLQTSGNYSGALHLEYRDFTRQYEYIHQLMTRNQWNCYLVMVTMETVQDTLPYIEEIEEALDHMGEAIQDNIRKVDVCTRYSAMQYLIILSHPAETQIPNIMSRIFMEYYKLQDSQHFTPSYEYISMKK